MATQIMSVLFSFVTGLLLQSVLNRFDLWQTRPVSMAMSISLSAVMLLVLIQFFVGRKRNKFFAGQSRDFKFFADLTRDEECLADLFKRFNKGGVQRIGEDPIALPADRGAPGYIPSHEFFASDGKFIKNFSCHALRNKEKSDKIFLQVAFVPVDRNGKTLLIRRLPQYHPIDFILDSLRFSRKRPSLTLVSFSPVPSSFSANSFAPELVYGNEVPKPWGPLKNTPVEFKELGSVIRKDPEKSAIYLFYVFKAVYTTVEFDGTVVGEDGVKASSMKYLFYADGKAYARNEAFLKDHDEISAIVPLKTITAFTTDVKQLPNPSGSVFTKEYWHTWKVRHLLKNVKLKAVEKVVYNLFA